MPVKERERFVPDEEARELERLFVMRDVRRYCRDRENGTLYYTEKWKGAGDGNPSVLPAASHLPLHKGGFGRAVSLGCGVAAAVCWFCVLGAVGALETNRVELLPGVLAMCGFCIAAVLFGALAAMTRQGVKR